MECTLLFPHQLFRSHPAAKKDRPVYLYEDPLFFTQYAFHKNKLILHRASLKYTASYLQQQDHDVTYVSCQEKPELSDLFDLLAGNGVSSIHLVRPVDYLLERRLRRCARKHDIALEYYESPMFLLTREEVADKLGEKKNYFMARFYKQQRKDFDLLMDGDEPAGGKWSFDEENRKKLPKQETPPEIYIPQENEYVQEARKYVDAHFADNPGDTDNFIYPVTYYQADKWLENFLEHRMELFGDYEDAMSTEYPFIYHSVLTPALNVGLLTPDQVLDTVMEWHGKKNYPLNCLEGFIRQIIGWREFMRGIYELEGVYERTTNHFGHDRPIPDSFWTGETGIPPIDDVIRKILKYGYAHHIERLMLLGNFMMLCEFDPDEVYRWFMELFIDAYDWVMVPNVYGMILYADGGLITTKPYISGSNYVRKMSTYKKGEWAEIWDGLYWRFLHVHKKELKENGRMNMVMSLLERMNEEKLENHLNTAKAYLAGLTREANAEA